MARSYKKSDFISRYKKESDSSYKRGFWSQQRTKQKSFVHLIMMNLDDGLDFDDPVYNKSDTPKGVMRPMNDEERADYRYSTK